MFTSSSVWITDRHPEILRLVARGMTSKEIARHERITLHTVYTHIRRARRRHARRRGNADR